MRFWIRGEEVIFLTVKEVSRLVGVQERTIRNNVQKGKYGDENKGFVYINGRGGYVKF